MVFDFDRFLSLSEIDQIYSIPMNGNEMMVFLSEGDPKGNDFQAIRSLGLSRA